MKSKLADAALVSVYDDDYVDEQNARAESERFTIRSWRRLVRRFGEADRPMLHPLWRRLVRRFGKAGTHGYIHCGGAS